MREVAVSSGASRIPSIEKRGTAIAPLVLFEK
jgi:hypothetical protein